MNLNYDYISNPKSENWNTPSFSHFGIYQWHHIKTNTKGQQAVFCRTATTLDELVAYWNSVQDAYVYTRIA